MILVRIPKNKTAINLNDMFDEINKMQRAFEKMIFEAETDELKRQVMKHWVERNDVQPRS